MNRERAPQRARRRVISIASGNGGTIEPGESPVRKLPVGFGHADGLRPRRPGDRDIRRRKRGGAHHAAALSVDRMRRLARDQAVVRRNGPGIMIDHMIDYGRIMNPMDPGLRVRRVAILPVVIDMRRHARMIVMETGLRVNALTTGQTVRRGLAAGQRERKRRRQHAKQISEGNDPPRPQPPRSAHADKHPRPRLRSPAPEAGL